MGKRKLLLSGSSVAELRKECEEFLRETAGTTVPEYPYPPKEEDKQLPLVPQPQSPVAAAVTTGPTQGADTGPVPTHDSRGVPWDSRIHSSNREITKDGSWRKRRGTEPAEVARVEAELLRGGSQPVPQQYPPQPVAPPVAPLGNGLPPAASPAPVAPIQPSVPQMSPSTATIAQPGPAPVIPLHASTSPPAPAQQVVSLAHNLATFKANMPMVIAKLVQDGKINQEYIASVKQSCGVQEIWQLTEAQQAEWFEMLCQYNLITRMP